VAVYAGAAIRYRSQHFADPGVALNLLTDNTFLGVAAVGMTFVIISGGIDLSVGAVMGLSAIVIGVLIEDYGWNVYSAIGAALAMGGVLGGAMGAAIQWTGLRPFIVTLAGMFFARGLAFLIHLESIGIADPGHVWLASAGIAVPGAGRLTIGAMVLLGAVGLAWLVLARTPFGRNVYAIGGSEDSAVLMGLPVARTKVAVYAISGLCAALAGALLTLYLGSANHSDGVGLELDAIAAVVIGGTLLSGGVGSVLGTLVGVLIIGIIQVAITTYETRPISSGMTRVAIGGMLLVFVLMQRVVGGAGGEGVMEVRR
jgi:ribose/xylose/arabinose/galactoside ABC-type transport system permease subunit